VLVSIPAVRVFVGSALIIYFGLAGSDIVMVIVYCFI